MRTRDLFSDSDGTQTHDLQNRNLTLYSTELPSHDGLQIEYKVTDFL